MPNKLVKLLFIKSDALPEYHSNDAFNDNKPLNIVKDQSEHEVSEGLANYLMEHWPENFLLVDGEVYKAYKAYQKAASDFQKSLKESKGGDSDKSKAETKGKK